jgi:hypothetical protein
MTASRAIVRKKIQQYWPKDMDHMMAILDRFGDSSTAKVGRARVQLAVLKLANGSLLALKDYVDLAIQDYRGVLASAEYPRQLMASHLATKDLSPQQQKELEIVRKLDREQYLTWLQQPPQ